MSYTEAHKRISEQMPHFIAVHYQAMIDASTNEARVRAGLATFERCLYLLTIIMVSQYLIHDREDVSDPHLNRLLAEQFPLGDLQSWRNVFTTALKAYEGHPEWFFVPEVYDLYWDTFDPEHHHPRPDFEQMLDQLVALSNDWQSRKNLPSNVADWTDLAQTVNALVSDLLERLVFLTNYELLYINEVSETECSARRYAGLEIATIEFECKGEYLQPNWYYLAKDRREFLLLDPLLTSLHIAQEETAIFRRLTTYHQLRYLLAVTGKLFTDTTRLEEFMALMLTIGQVKQAIRKKEDLTWLQVTATAEEITASRMATVSGKFDQDVYLQRQDALNLFDAFRAADSRCFVLTGKSGVGKSNFVLSLQDEYKTEPDICLLMIDASQIDVDKGLSTFISDEFCRRWGLRLEDMPDVWEEIDRLPGMDHRIVLLILDAINESRQPQVLLNQVNELLQQSWKWLKVLITSRPEAWRRICHGQSLAESLFFQPSLDTSVKLDELPYLAACDLKLFGWSELPVVYTRYQTKFDLQTSYDDLAPEARQLIREPLQLWMIANTYRSENIPRELPAGFLVENYISALLKTKRLYPEDIRFLRRELVPLMAREPGLYTNVIVVTALEEAGGNLLERVFSEGYYSTGERVNAPLQRLADAQIVTSQIQGIDSAIFFKYERFYDYFLGEHLYTQIPKRHANLAQGYRALFVSIEEYPFIWGAVQRALYLTLRDRQFELIKTLAMTDNEQIAHLIVTALVEFSAEDANAVRQIVRSLLSSGRRALLGSKKAWLTAKDIALKVALQTTDSDALLLGLLSPNQDINSRAVQYVYFLNQVHSKLGLDVFEGLIEPTRRFGLPNYPVIRAAFYLGSILLTENKEDEVYRERLLAIIQRILRRAMYADNRSFMGNVFRTWVLKFIVQNALRVIRLASSTRIAASNFEEWERAFVYSVPEKAAVLEMLPYLDYRHGTWDEIAILLPKVRSLRAQLLNQVPIFAILPRGSLQPDEALPVIEQLFDSDDGGNWARIDAIYAWCVILDYQQQIKNVWLAAQKRFVKKCLEESTHGYGIIKTDLGRYAYYPLMFYASTWNWVYPNQEVDLIVYFLHQAEKTNDRELLLHVIDGFGDRRLRLTDYRGPLRSLKPFVKSQDKEVREHLVDSLARLYGAYPEQISHFLLESESPRELLEAVRQRSLDESTPALYLRGNFFLRDALLNFTSDAMQIVVEVLADALRQKTIYDAAELIIKNLLNELSGEGGIFFKL